MASRALGLVCVALLVICSPVYAVVPDTATIATNLDTPWEIAWGPDDWIWVTERAGRISRINPRTGEKRQLIQISSVHEQDESGLLGFAFHPDFERSPLLYTVYTYSSSGVIRERLVRFTYSQEALSGQTILLDSIPGDRFHNGSRLLFLPDTTLLMTTGDARLDASALNVSSLVGKVLRLNADGSRPADNPFGNYVWSYGHRNAQGLVRLPNGNILSSEHGPNTDDELNLIVKGGNYGWPQVAGFCNTPSEVNYCGANQVKVPLRVWTPTLAVCGIDYYNHPAFPEWKNSILMVTLKEADVRVLSLNDAGDSITREQILFDNWWGRLRDLCVSPEGEVYLAVSNRDGRGTVRAGDDRIVKVFARATALKRRFTARTAKALESSTTIYDLRGKKIQGAQPGSSLSGPVGIYVAASKGRSDAKRVLLGRQ